MNQNKRVLLVYPTQDRLFEHPSLGLMYIAAVLEKAGHKVKIIEGSGLSLADKCVNNVQTFKPDVVGFTCMTPHYNDVINAAQQIGNCGASKPLIAVGGPHATIMPETFAGTNVNVVVKGEGENAFAALLEEPEVWSGTDEPQICEGTPCEDLDVIPFPARHLVNPEYFARHRTPIMASRGCQFNCAFCQPTLRKIFGKKVRKRSAENVCAEMLQCRAQLGINHFEFFDDTFTSNPAWTEEFCSKAEQINNSSKADGFKKISWEILTRVDSLTDDLVVKMKNSGMRRITFGVESGSQEILNGYQKGTTIKQIKEAFAICKRHKIRTHGLFMLGSPEETWESIKATKQLIHEIKPDTIFISITTPLPHTCLWDKAEKEQLLTCDWKKIDYYRTPSMKLKNLEQDEVIKAKHDILRSFYQKRVLNPSWTYKYIQERGLSYGLTVAKHVLIE